MSDVMKAINKVESTQPRTLVHQATVAYNYPTLRDHIGELHPAIAELAEIKVGDLADEVIARINRVTNLLPTDWAGETE